MPLDGSTIVDQTGQEILDALELLRKDGWCVGTQYDDQGRRCALGAVFGSHPCTVQSRQDYTIPIVHRLAVATGRNDVGLISHDPHGWGASIAYYNNAQTDFAVIEDWFLRAAYAAPASRGVRSEPVG